MPKVVAMVSMKGHSARVPGKNVRPLAGKPLFYWILNSLNEALRVDQTIVETDSDEIAHLVKSYFPNLPIFRRPDALCGDEVPMNLLIEFNMDNVAADIYIHTHSTNPLLRARTVDSAIEAFINRPIDRDSLFGVTEWRTRLFRADGSALYHNPDELIPTQDLAPVYEENSNIYAFTRDSFAKLNHRIGVTPILFPIDRREAVDIDDEEDFEFAEFLMRKRLAEEK